ncbi:MAG: sugar transferase [Candidatus Berkelbacteria bacterium]|nr:sugar transferase [Candidatus Berkelbacteria bacterium]
MKKIDQLFTFLLVPIDALMILISFVCAYKFRAEAFGFPVIYIWPFDQYLRFTLLMLPIWIIAFAFAGLYNTKRKAIAEFGHIISGASLGAMAVVLWVFLFRSDFFSRLIVFYIWAFAIVFTQIGRAILGLIKSNLYILGLKKKKLAFIGIHDTTSLNLLEQIKRNPSLGYKFEGFVSNHDLSGDKFKYLGKTDELENIIKKHEIDEVILTDTQANPETLFILMRSCQENGVIFKAVPAHAQVSARTLQFDAFAGVPIIEFRGTPLDNWGIVFKRVADIIASIIAMIVLSPIIAVISIAIKINSKGPIVYKNIRIGDKGEFETLKFRTMRIEDCTGVQYGGSRAEELENNLIENHNIKKGSAVYKIANDPRVTSVGSFLRKTSLDELPQFLNVLIGNMSLIGPRPHQPKEVQHYTKEQRKLLLIKPGISGLAQISGRSDLTFDEEARLDISYLENWSIWLDLYIILKTFSAIFKGKGSY